MRNSFTAKIIDRGLNFVNPTIERQNASSSKKITQTRKDLRPDLRELLEQYKNGVLFSRKTGDAAVAALSQGEIDVLQQVAEVLGWKSLESLAVKYFPKFPNRKWWLEARRRVLKYARLKNIVYFLLCLQSIQKEWTEKAFSGREALNRLIHQHKPSSIGYVNRLDTLLKADTFIRGKYGPLLAPAAEEAVC